MRILFFYATLITVINVLQFLDDTNSFWYELFTVVEASAFIGFLYLQIKNVNVKKALLVIGSAFIVFNILYPYLVTEAKLFDSIPIGIETIIILIFSFYYLYEKTNDTTTLYIYSTFSFWIVIGMVLYLAGSFFIYLFAASISKNILKPYWSVTNILSILKNLLFAVGIIVNSKPTKKISLSDYELSSLN